jgi:DNA-binding MarR family transcriptional regulator
MDIEEKEPGGKSGSEIVLGVLTSVEQNHLITQRSLATELGIALGLTNAYLKRCIRKGLIKIKSVPPRRYAYYLTADGFLEKSRLTGEYLQASFGFFRLARKQCEAVLDECRQRGWKRIALYGLSEIAEVAQLCSPEFGVEVVGVVDAKGGTLGNLKAVASLEELPQWDAILLTTVQDPQTAYDALIAATSADRVLSPRMLRVSRLPRAPAGDTETVGQAPL